MFMKYSWFAVNNEKQVQRSFSLIDVWDFDALIVIETELGMIRLTRTEAEMILRKTDEQLNYLFKEDKK